MQILKKVFPRSSERSRATGVFRLGPCLKMRPAIAAGAVVIGLAASGCVKISGSIFKTIKQNDFMKSQMVVAGAAPADGVSNLLVGVQLKNSDNSAVSDYRPEYEIVSGTGVIMQACTNSNRDGIAACILKAIQPGVKTMRLTNARVGLKQDVTFEIPTGTKMMNIVSGGDFTATTPQGSKLKLSLGESVQGINRTTAGGYKVRFSVHGAVTSR